MVTVMDMDMKDIRITMGINSRMETGYQGVYNRCIKRCIDLPLALILLLVMLPIYTVIALAIAIDSGLPIFYRAERGGYQGKKFKIFKFRTMVPNADQIGGGTTALNDPRITNIGKFLRKTKLDETVQLLNIIKGEMSFVGPRPELVQYTNNYKGEELLILAVRPGITDFSSLKFINLDELVGEEHADAMYEQKVLKIKNELRIKYAKQVSPKVDVSLFLQTGYRALGKILALTFK